MTLLDAMRCIGPGGGGSGEDGGRRDDAAAVVWQALSTIRLRGFGEDVLEEARAVLIARLFSRTYTLTADTDFQCRAYLRRALYRVAIDVVRGRAPKEPPSAEAAAPEPAAEPRLDLLLDVLEDVVAMWGRTPFSMARDRLLSQELLRRTVVELVEIASGNRDVREVLAVNDGATSKEWSRRWNAYKRRCQRTVRALLLLLPAVAAERGWADPSFGTIPLRKLKDLEVVVDDPNTSPQLRHLVTALVAVATSYQRALVGAAPQGM